MINSYYKRPDSTAVDTGTQSMPVAAYEALPVTEKASMGLMGQQASPQYTTPSPAPIADPTPPPAANGGTGSSGGTGSRAMNDYASMMSSLLGQIDLKGAANEAASIQGNLKNEQEDFAKWGLGESNRQADTAFANADKSKGYADTNIADMVARTQALLGSQQGAFSNNADNRRAGLEAGIAERASMSNQGLNARNSIIDQLATAMGRSTDGMFQQNLKSVGSADANIRNMIGERQGAALRGGMEQDLLEGQQALDYRGEDFDFQILSMERKAEEEYQQRVQMAQAMANAGLINFDSAMAQIESNYVQSMKQIEQMKVEADMAKNQMIVSALETLFNMSQIES